MEPPSFLEPLIDALPPEVQGFMNAGGWLLPAGVAGLVALLILWAIVRRLFKRQKPPVAEVSLTEDLSTYPQPPAVWGSKRLTVHGLPARVRLVVAAPLGKEAGKIHPDEVNGLLENLVPGLGAFVTSDKPRTRIWPTQLSHQGFLAAFLRHTLVPHQTDRKPSRWVLLLGKVVIEGRPIGLGLALLADKDNTLGRITVEHQHQWAETLRVKS